MIGPTERAIAKDTGSAQKKPAGMKRKLAVATAMRRSDIGENTALGWNMAGSKAEQGTLSTRTRRAALKNKLGLGIGQRKSGIGAIIVRALAKLHRLPVSTGHTAISDIGDRVSGIGMRFGRPLAACLDLASMLPVLPRQSFSLGWRSRIFRHLGERRPGRTKSWSAARREHRPTAWGCGWGYHPNRWGDTVFTTAGAFGYGGGY